MNIDEERVLKLQDRMTRPLPSYTDGQINHKTKITINESQNSQKVDSAMIQNNSLLSNFRGSSQSKKNPEVNHDIPILKNSGQKNVWSSSSYKNNRNQDMLNNNENPYKTEQKPTREIYNESINKNSSEMLMSSNIEGKIQEKTPCFKEKSAAPKKIQATLDSYCNMSDLFQKRRYDKDKESMGLNSNAQKMKITSEYNAKEPVQNDHIVGSDSDSSLYNVPFVSKAQATKLTDFFKYNNNNLEREPSQVFGNVDKNPCKDYGTISNNHNGANAGNTSINFQKGWSFGMLKGNNYKSEYHNEVSHGSNYGHGNFDPTIKFNEINQKYLQEIDRLKSNNCHLEKVVKDKNNTINEIDEELKNSTETNNNYKNNVKKLTNKMVLKIEQLQRQENKTFIDQQKNRLGENCSYREGIKNKEIWVDGFEIKKIKQRLTDIKTEKEDLEQLKKNLKFKKSEKNGLTVPNIPKNVLNELIYGTGFSGENLYDSGKGGALLEKNVIEVKDRLTAQILTQTREEDNLKDQLDRLEGEKISYLQEAKRLFEEYHCRFGKPSYVLGVIEEQTKPWPILENRYQLLSQLGKGGFSEVYKAFDLDELAYVACKIHQLNPNWKEESKANYIKHALRENAVHREMHHPNIVMHLNSAEIDANSFCTVLEYCEGPDLSFYQKKHKSLSEKEAKNLIKQILAGLKFLNEKRVKVIHYDLKPQNIIFHKGLVKIVDFGLCKVMNDDDTKMELTSQGVGTYWYLPPECFESRTDNQPPKISTKVDVWSIGVMFFEMQYGQRPFGHGMSQDRVLKEQVMLNAKSVVFPSSDQKLKVSNEIKEFIKKCLEFYSVDRYSVIEAYNAIHGVSK